MFRDRYGETFSSDERVTIFSQNLSYDSEFQDEGNKLRPKDFDTESFDSAFEVDLGAGADWPFIAYQVLSSVAPVSILVSTFFLGERIEKNFKAWRRISRSLLGLTPEHAFLDRNGAAVLALSKLSEIHSVNEVKLLAYQWIDSNMTFPRQADVAEKSMDLIASLSEIAPADSQFGIGLHGYPQHLFKIEADGRIYLVRVLKTETFIRQLNSK